MKRKLLLVSLFFVLAMSMVLTACGGAQEKESKVSGDTETETSEPIVIKFTHVVDERSPKGKAANLFRDLVAERLDGKVKVEVYPNSQLYDDLAGLEALQAGNIQMMAPSNSKMIGLDPAFQIFMIPFLFQDNETVLEFSTSEKGQELYSNVEKFNVKVLTTWLGGFMQMSNDVRAIETPEDMKGIKFRVMSGGILADQYEALGAGATVIPFSETYVALQQGTVDGQENPYNNIETQKFYEVQKYVTETRHAPATYPLIVNADFWNGLPDDIRTELNKIVEEVTLKEVEWTDELNQESLQIIKDAGTTEINVLTDEQRQVFKEALQPVYDEYSEVVGKEYVDYVSTLKK